MQNDEGINQTPEEDLLKLAEMARVAIESGRVSYITSDTGRTAELYKIRCWIIEHSPKWREKGIKKLIKGMAKVGLN